MPKALSITFVVPYFYPAWAYGGIPRLAYGLARTLAAQGHTLQILTTDAFDQTQRIPKAQKSVPGLKIHHFPNLSNRLAYSHQGFIPLGLRPFLKTMPPPDVLHIHGHRHLLGALAHRYAVTNNIPLILTPNGTLPNIERKARIKGVFDQILGDGIVKDATQMIAVSRAEVAQFRLWGVPSARISHIPNGIDLAEFDQMPTPGVFRKERGIKGKQVVLYLGKITPRKGLDHLIDAFALMGRPELALVIAGNDMTGLLPSLMAQTKKRGVQDQVHFVGLLTGEERLKALATADVLAYPSNHEIFGLVPFEGLLAGAPAVVGDDCGCGELVHAANAGLLVRYGDSYALKAALLRLLDNPQDRAARVARGQSYIRQHFSWHRVAQQTVQVYKRAVT